MPHAPTDRLQPTLPTPESTPLPPEPWAGELHGLALIAALDARLVLETVAGGRSRTS